MKVDATVESELQDDVRAWRSNRDEAAVRRALDELRRVALDDGPTANIMEPTIALAHAGGTTGEWSAVLRKTFGDTRPDGRLGRRGHRAANCRQWSSVRRPDGDDRQPAALLVAKPGLDGHSNGASRSPLLRAMQASRSSTRASG